MARSTYYSAYKYEWTMLVNALVDSSQALEVSYEDDNQAENQRQEWYAFLRALQSEIKRAHSRGASDSEAHFAQLHNQAQQIACQRRGSTLRFIKKSATPIGKKLRKAIEEQLGTPDPGATTLGEAPTEPDSTLDPMTSALQGFVDETSEDPSPAPSLDEERQQKDEEYARRMNELFGGDGNPKDLEDDEDPQKEDNE